MALPDGRKPQPCHGRCVVDTATITGVRCRKGHFNDPELAYCGICGIGLTQAGTGLGLYITRQLVRAMGGNVSVEDMPGGGSTFTMHLPQRSYVPAPSA